MKNEPPRRQERQEVFATPFGFASSLRRETRLQDWTHQSPRSGNPPAALARLSVLARNS